MILVFATNNNRTEILKILRIKNKKSIFLKEYILIYNSFNDF